MELWRDWSLSLTLHFFSPRFPLLWAWQALLASSSSSFLFLSTNTAAAPNSVWKVSLCWLPDRRDTTDTFDFLWVFAFLLDLSQCVPPQPNPAKFLQTFIYSAKNVSKTYSQWYLTLHIETKLERGFLIVFNVVVPKLFLYRILIECCSRPQICNHTHRCRAAQIN